jgi:hypothetical protein
MWLAGIRRFPYAVVIKFYKVHGHLNLFPVLLLPPHPQLLLLILQGISMLKWIIFVGES